MQKNYTIVRLICTLLLLCFTVNVQPQQINYYHNSALSSIGQNVEILSDTFQNYNSASILYADKFKKSTKKVEVFPVTKNDIWLRFSAANQTKEPTLFFFIPYYNITQLELYKLTEHGLKHIYKNGNGYSFNSYFAATSSYIANLSLTPGKSSTYYIHLVSHHPILLPLFVASHRVIEKAVSKETLIVFTYLGMLVAVFLYNLFLYITTKDKNYLLYIIYIFLLGFAQFTLAGFTFKILWPSLPFLNNYAVPVTSSFAGLSAIFFTTHFLKTKQYTPKAHLVFIVCTFLFFLAILLSIFSLNNYSYKLLEITQSGAGITAIVSSFLIAKSGYRPALYYLISWLSLAVGLIIFSLRNSGILPYNNFTTYILYLGSAIEVVLLSIALADKINVLKKEALKASQENEKLVLEQNIVLEQKVAHRTEELQSANAQLNGALTNLKDTQTQLVEAEKMASLGQLTAGIAHEINNPINFVKSNITPLRLDLKDLIEVLDEYNKLHLTPEIKINEQLTYIKQLQDSIDFHFIKNEINDLIKGIEEGAERTAEIVKGLRTFSRLDESELKKVNIHAGINSTLIILRNSIPEYIKLEKHFEADGEVECLPGKINQVFMNIINNSVQAITVKEQKRELECISISTYNVNDNHIEIRIKDTGIGMTEEAKHKVFEPFFTTKNVGEGTGLGMAIVFKIIQRHNGKIEIISEVGKGAEFIITLPCELSAEAI